MATRHVRFAVDERNETDSDQYSPAMDWEQLELLHDRPRDQWSWQEQDLIRLRRDREEAQQVRDLYNLVNAETVFADSCEAGDEDSISARNYLPNPEDESRFWRTDTADEDDVVMTGVEIVEMHQTGGYSQLPQDTPARCNSTGVQEINLQDGDVPESPVEVHHVRRDEMGEYQVPFPWDRIRFSNPGEALVDALSDAASSLPEEQGVAEGWRVYEIAAYHSRNPNIEQWERRLATDMFHDMHNATTDYRERQQESREFWQHFDRAWRTRSGWKEDLEECQANEQELLDNFTTAMLRFGREDPVNADIFMKFTVHISKVAKTKVRKHDILSWYFDFPAHVRTALSALCEHYRTEACIKLNIRWWTAQADGIGDDAHLDDEEEWAGEIYSQFGVGYGYENRPLNNGFAAFFPPSDDTKLKDRMRFISSSCAVRDVRLGLAYKRLRDGNDEPSDKHIFELMRIWFGQVYRYLNRHWVPVDVLYTENEAERESLMVWWNEVFQSEREMEEDFGQQRVHPSEIRATSQASNA